MSYPLSPNFNVSLTELLASPTPMPNNSGTVVDDPMNACNSTSNSEPTADVQARDNDTSTVTNEVLSQMTLQSDTIKSLEAQIEILQCELSANKKTDSYKKSQIKKLTKENDNLKREISKHNGIRKFTTEPTRVSNDNTTPPSHQGSSEDELLMAKARIKSLESYIRDTANSLLNAISDDQSSMSAATVNVDDENSDFEAIVPRNRFHSKATQTAAAPVAPSGPGPSAKSIPATSSSSSAVQCSTGRSTLWQIAAGASMLRRPVGLLAQILPGITVLPIFAKIFEIAFHDRLQLVCEAFGLQDEYNGGFVKGNKTTDNMFILNSLIQRQILKGDSLIVCFVDFSKAFDVISRNILFYKLIKYGIHGRIIDTMRSLYSKIRVKCNGKISYPVFDVSGVNQGGSASSGLFRRYLADLSEYLSCSVGVCLDEEIVLHLLWSDDLLFISDTMESIQKQLDGLATFCYKNLMILNEAKTKLLVFGKDKFHNGTNSVMFNNKYLGNIFHETRTIRGDVFKHTYDYLCVKSQRDLFSLNKQLNHLGTLPPKLSLHLFKTNIEPILTYGSEIWGTNKSGCDEIDTFSLRFMKSVLGVKSSTSTIAVYEELGFFPPSLVAHTRVLCYYKRLLHMSSHKLARRAFESQMSLHNQGFNTWIGKVKELSWNINIDIDNADPGTFKELCKKILKDKFIEKWNTSLNNGASSILRTYATFKQTFEMGFYLENVNQFRYRNAITKLRVSSHALEIERGRHCGLSVEERVCGYCHCIEGEKHFLFHCSIVKEARHLLNTRICSKYSHYTNLSDKQKMFFLFTSRDPQLLSWQIHLLCTATEGLLSRQPIG